MVLMTDDPDSERGEEAARDESLLGRRVFLRDLRKWSAVIIGGAVLGRLAEQEARAGWVNRRGRLVNGGGSWVNTRDGWINR